MALDLKTLEYQPSQKARFASVEGRAQYRRSAAAAARADGTRPTAPARSCGGSSATCSSTPPDGPRDFRSHRRNRPRHALGLRQQARPVRAVGRAGLRRNRRAHAQGAAPDSGERREDALHAARNRSIKRPTTTAVRITSTSISPANSYKWLDDRPGITVLKDVKHAHGVVKKNGGASLIDLGDGVLCLRVPQQDELARRRPDLAHPRGHRRNQQEFRSHDHRQPGRELQRRREPDAGAAGRAGRRVGRTGSGHPPLPAGQHGDEVCAQAGGIGAVRHDAGRRLRNRHAFGARAGVGGDLHGPGRSRRRRDSRRGRQQGNAAALRRCAQGFRTDRLRQSVHQRRGGARSSDCCARRIRSP